MMKREEWSPIGIDSVEPEAERAIRSSENLLVLAGPGAGKTELLAQKASFALMTNSCSNPKRILAISFKKDSAKNLKERVATRCGTDLAIRFDSYTFDAFAKHILDQFRNCLPKSFLISQEYEIDFNLDNNLLLGILQSLNYQDRPGNGPLIKILTSDQKYINWQLNKFKIDYLTSYRLDDHNRNREFVLNWAADQVWDVLVAGNPKTKTSVLSFAMITRLAEQIVRSNPYVLKALRETYEYIFLDEFQDTTSIQYDFLKSCFQESSCSITAVGDRKQRIMLWAGAMATVFEEFRQDFGAADVQLVMNYRCAPKLIDLQTVVARNLNSQALAQQSFQKEGGVLKQIDFKDSNQEAILIAKKIQSLIHEGVRPSDICFLFKQKVDFNASLIINELKKYEIKARSEEKYQDLLKEDFIILLLDFIKYIFDIEKFSWNDCVKYLISEDVDVVEARVIEDEIEQFKLSIQEDRDSIFKDSSSFLSFINNLTKLVGEKNIQQLGGQYSSDYTESLIQQFCSLFYETYVEEDCINRAVNSFLGEGIVPCMTIHKSKGLEFEVVFLIGLEDDLFWGYKKQPVEETQAFFVAISRPINHLYITFSSFRNGKQQDRKEIAPFYTMLREGGAEYISHVGQSC